MLDEKSDLDLLAEKILLMLAWEIRNRSSLESLLYQTANDPKAIQYMTYHRDKIKAIIGDAIFAKLRIDVSDAR